MLIFSFKYFMYVYIITKYVQKIMYTLKYYTPNILFRSYLFFEKILLLSYLISPKNRVPKCILSIYLILKIKQKVRREDIKRSLTPSSLKLQLRNLSFSS
jgi:hypothetical protein